VREKHLLKVSSIAEAMEKEMAEEEFYLPG
jgi:hypothetical protein